VTILHTAPRRVNPRAVALAAIPAGLLVGLDTTS